MAQTYRLEGNDAFQSVFFCFFRHFSPKNRYFLCIFWETKLIAGYSYGKINMVYSFCIRKYTEFTLEESIMRIAQPIVRKIKDDPASLKAFED